MNLLAIIISFRLLWIRSKEMAASPFHAAAGIYILIFAYYPMFGVRLPSRTLTRVRAWGSPWVDSSIL